MSIEGLSGFVFPFWRARCRTPMFPGAPIRRSDEVALFFHFSNFQFPVLLLIRRASKPKNL